MFIEKQKITSCTLTEYSVSKRFAVFFFSKLQPNALTNYKIVKRKVADVLLRLTF